MGGPAAFSQRPGSSGEGAKAGGLQCAPRSSLDVVSKPRELRAARGGRQLLGRSAVPNFPLPSSGAEIPSASWGVFPRQGWSMVFPRRCFNKSRMSLTSLRKLLVWLKGCSCGTEGFWLTLGDDPSCRRMGLGARGISTKQERGLGF